MAIVRSQVVRRRSAPRVTGTGGVTLPAGTVVTGAALRDIVMWGERTRVTYRARTPDVQRGCHMLEVLAGGEWIEAMEADQADWSYFVVSLTSLYDRATVVEASDDAVEVAWQYNAHSFTNTPIPYRDWNNGINYSQGAVNPNFKTITSTKLIKTIRVQRGEPGYYVGYHSDPRVGPHGSQIPAQNNETAWGERELGLSGGSAAAWASTGRIARWPAWADDVDGRWTAAGLQATANKVWWPGIDDATYAPYNSSAWISTQQAGFPAEQATGPFYVCDIHYSKPVAKILAMRQRFEVGGWKVGTYGGIVLHHTNEAHAPTGVPYRHQAFIGGVHYAPDSSSAFANEPRAGIVRTMDELAAGLRWPEF